MDEVEIPAGEGSASARGYVMSATGGAGLGLLLISDDWSASPHARALCDRFVAEGFTALVPDLPSPEPDLERAARGLGGAVDLLCTHEAVRGGDVGVIGFSRAGGLALWLAVVRPERIRAVVPFYGLPAVGREPDWTLLQGSVEGHFAEDDDFVTRGAVEALEEKLSGLGKEVRMFVYPGTRHGFFDDTRPELYDADAARQAWVRTLEFLRAKLG